MLYSRMSKLFFVMICLFQLFLFSNTSPDGNIRASVNNGILVITGSNIPGSINYNYLPEIVMTPIHFSPDSRLMAVITSISELQRLSRSSQTLYNVRIFNLSSATPQRPILEILRLNNFPSAAVGGPGPIKWSEDSKALIIEGNRHSVN